MVSKAEIMFFMFTDLTLVSVSLKDALMEIRE